MFKLKGDKAGFGNYILDVGDESTHSGPDRPALACREVRHG